MIGPGIAHELARQRELAIVRDLERPRRPDGDGASTLMPTLSIAVAIVAIVALGGPV
jgi:hypothetical protein